MFVGKSTMSNDEIKFKLLAYLNLGSEQFRYNVVIEDEKTFVNDYFLVLYYNTYQFLKEGNNSLALAGNYPIGFNKLNNKFFYIFDSSYPIISLKSFEETFKDYKEIDMSIIE